MGERANGGPSGAKRLLGCDDDPPVSYRLLGPVELRVRDATVPIGGPRVQAMLAALLLDADRVVTIDRIVETTWGDRPPERARVQVQNRISGLRRRLRDTARADPIETHGAGYRLRIGVGCLDVDRFDGLVRDATARAVRTDLIGAAGALESALAFWRGNALEGLRTPRLLAAAQRLEESRLAACEAMIDLKIGIGRHRSVIGELVELVAEHPFRERLTGQLMTALLLAGRQQESLDQFERLRRRLGTELGLDPGPEITLLHARILRGQCPPGAPVLVIRPNRRTPDQPDRPGGNRSGRW